MRTRRSQRAQDGPKASGDRGPPVHDGSARDLRAAAHAVDLARQLTGLVPVAHRPDACAESAFPDIFGFPERRIRIARTELACWSRAGRAGGLSITAGVSAAQTEVGACLTALADSGRSRTGIERVVRPAWDVPGVVDHRRRQCGADRGGSVPDRARRFGEDRHGGRARCSSRVGPVGHLSITVGDAMVRGEGQLASSAVGPMWDLLHSCKCHCEYSSSGRRTKFSEKENARGG